MRFRHNWPIRLYNSHMIKMDRVEAEWRSVYPCTKATALSGKEPSSLRKSRIQSVGHPERPPSEQAAEASNVTGLLSRQRRHGEEEHLGLSRRVRCAAGGQPRRVGGQGGFRQSPIQGVPRKIERILRQGRFY